MGLQVSMDEFDLHIIYSLIPILAAADRDRTEVLMMGYGIYLYNFMPVHALISTMIPPARALLHMLLSFCGPS